VYQTSRDALVLSEDQIDESEPGLVWGFVEADEVVDDGVEEVW
jgi:hypothetical protein